MNTQTNQELVKSSVNFSPALMQSERGFITDYYSPKISQIEHIEVEKYCRELVVKAFLDVGQAKVDNTIIKLMTGGLIGEILPYKNTISLSGVKTAIEKGIRKEYGEYYGINSVSFNQFLKGYMNSVERLDAVTKQKEYERNIIIERENAKNLDAGKEFTLYSFEKYNETKEIYDPHDIAYDWLKKNNLIPGISKELKEDIRTEAEARFYRSKMNNEGVQASSFIMKKLGKGEKKKTAEEEILNICKNIHLKHIYEVLKIEQIQNIK